MKRRSWQLTAPLAAITLAGITLPAIHDVNAQAAPQRAPGSGIDDVPLQKIIAAVSARTGQVFVIDPRVNATVKAPGMRLESLTFSDLQSILAVHGYTAVAVGSLYKIIPDEGARQAPLPVVSDRAGPGGRDQFITKVLQPRRLTAAALVTALRPLLPKEATITANPSTNSLIVVASAGDIEAVEIMLLELEAAR
jgi:general secretion pathway protein D